MTRFYAIAAAEICCAASELALRNYICFALVILIFLIVTGLGVAIPRFRLFGNFICRGSGSKKRVALTFDDGPDPRSTPQLLELLREHAIPATFFCIGKHVAAHPELAAQIIREGHVLENHSYTHSAFINFYSKSRLQHEMAQTQTAIEKATGRAPRFYRPPVGLTNPNTFRAARKLNLQVIGWTIRSFDTVIAEPQKIIARIKRGLQPDAIILLHDGNIPREKLLTTVKSLLDTLRATGYEIVRLDELLK
jgi:peptidoglycan/xylan/chitin deacetylase (PgdA/CDA1 family)